MDRPDLAWPDSRGYIDAFDGVRAIAVLLVIAFHSHFMLGGIPLGPLSGLVLSGWIGVDVFFALSGFLITGILIRSAGKPQAFRSFYIRRFLRIVPLYYGLVTLVLGSRALAGVAPTNPVWSYYAFVVNFFMADTPEDFALDVTWSLSVEEQFYVLWPALVMLTSRRVLVAAIVAIALASPAIRAFVYDPELVRSELWWRLDGLAIGGLGAVLWHARAAWAVRAARVLAWPGLGLLLALILLGVSSRHSFGWAVGGYSLTSIVVTVVLLAIASRGVPRLRGLLTLPPLVQIGRVSYGMYLLHPFVLAGLTLVWAKLPAGAGWVTLLTLVVPPALTTGIAVLVFRTIEAPILGLKDRLAPL